MINQYAYSYQSMTNSSSGDLDNITIVTAEIESLNNCKLTNCSVTSTPTTDLGIANKGYIDDEIIDKCFRLDASNNLTKTNVFTGNVSFTGTNTGFSSRVSFAGNINVGGQMIFTTKLPTSNIVPVNANSLVTKSYVDSLLVSDVSLSGNNNFTGINTFTNAMELDGNVNSYGQFKFYGFCPKSLIPATTSTDLINKNYLDGVVSGLPSLSGNNTFSGNTRVTSPFYNTSNYVISSYREAGVYLLKAISGSGNNIWFPIYKSITNLTNVTSQPTTSGSVTTPALGVVPLGSYTSLNFNDIDDRWYVLGNYGLVTYLNSGYSSSQIINFKNTTTEPVLVTGVPTSLASSVRVYFRDIEQL